MGGKYLLLVQFKLIRHLFYHLISMVYMKKIGSDYVGYYHYTLKVTGTTEPTDFGFTIIGVVIVVIWITKHRKKKI